MFSLSRLVLINRLKHSKYFSSQSNFYYITTPIFYATAAPHIGHLYSAVLADACCRYHKLKQPDATIRLCTGTDEHGTKIQQAAAFHNQPVSQYCEDVSTRYRNLFHQAYIAHDDFIRTTEERHVNAVEHFWKSLDSRGHIYSALYKGWYCVQDETFLTESQLRKDIETDKRYSLESGHSAEWTEETNYMFSLSKFQNDIAYWLKNDVRVRPAKFEKILLDSLSEPLPDVSISRPASRVHWAIPVPGDATQTVYVWLDALINYLSSLGYPDEKYCQFWPAYQHIIGKDILKFHGIYWPAFLIAAGLQPPQQLFVHSHWTVDGQKMSKSKNNVVDPIKAATMYTMEGLRYFLLREGVAHSDGNYSNIKALRILNSELADTLGNLLSRACAKTLNPKQIYPPLHSEHLQNILENDTAKRLKQTLLQLEARCTEHYEQNNFYLVADTVISALHVANNFFETFRPWELKSSKETDTNGNKALENAQKLETIISMTMDTLRLCGIILQPIIPQLSTRLLDKLSVPADERLWCSLNRSFAQFPNHINHSIRQLKTETGAILFKRIILNGSIGDNSEQQQQQQQQQQQHQRKN